MEHDYWLRPDGSAFVSATHKEPDDLLRRSGFLLGAKSRSPCDQPQDKLLPGNGRGEPAVKSQSTEDATLAQTLGLCIGMAALLVALGLLTSPIASRAVLALLYLSLFLLATGALHLVFVLDPRLGGVRYSTRAPKYLEYVYILTLLGSLGQIAIASPKLSEYFQVDEAPLRLQAQVQAREELARCLEHKSEQNMIYKWHYADEFCEKLRRLAEAPASALAGVIDDLVKDDAFRSFITVDVTMPEARRATKVPSRVAQEIDNIVTRRAIAEDAQVRRSNPFEWIALVLLPIGFALRITKTSMELFVDLVRPAAA